MKVATIGRKQNGNLTFTEDDRNSREGSNKTDANNCMGSQNLQRKTATVGAAHVLFNIK